MNKKTIRNIVYIGLGIAGIGLVGYRLGWFEQNTMAKPAINTSEAKKSTTQKELITSPLLPVSAVIVEAGTLSDILVVSGNLEADEEVEIKSEIDGVVTKIEFVEGKRVNRGQRLLKIEDDDLKAQIQRTQYQIELAEQQEQRRKQLLEKGGVSQEEYDEILTQLNTLRAELAILEVDLEKTEIKAPFNGKIGFKLVSEGSYLSPGTSVVRLVKLNPIKVSFSVPEKFGQQVRVGSKITFEVEGMAQTFEGTIFAKEPFIDPATRTQLIKAKSPNPTSELLPGSFASISIQLEEYGEALKVPTEAIIPELGGKKLYVYKSGKAISTIVETGIRRSDNIQILSGIQEGDTVITSGILQLKDGTPVQLSEINTQ